MTVRDYELSPDADVDICVIYDYTLANFGAAQAARYIGDLEPIFSSLPRIQKWDVNARKSASVCTALTTKVTSFFTTCCNPTCA